MRLICTGEFRVYEKVYIEDSSIEIQKGATLTLLPGVYIQDSKIVVRTGGDVLLGNTSRIYDTTINCYGKLTIGSGGRFNSSRVACQKFIQIGSLCLVGAYSFITDSINHALDAHSRSEEVRLGIKPHLKSNRLYIGDKCYFGSGCRILNTSSGEDLHIPGGTILGAGTTLKHSIDEPGVYCNKLSEKLRKI